MPHHFLETFVRDGFVQLQVPADEVPASVHALIADRVHALAAARERRKRARAVELVAAPAEAAARRIARNREKRDLAKTKRARFAARDGRAVRKRPHEA